MRAFVAVIIVHILTGLTVCPVALLIVVANVISVRNRLLHRKW